MLLQPIRAAVIDVMNISSKAAKETLTSALCAWNLDAKGSPQHGRTSVVLRIVSHNKSLSHRYLVDGGLIFTDATRNAGITYSQKWHCCKVKVQWNYFIGGSAGLTLGTS